MERLKDALYWLYEPREDEYISEGGVICCRNCHTPRRGEIGDNGEMTVIIQCKCQADEWEKSMAENRERGRRIKIEDNRRAGIRVTSYRNYTFANDDGKTPDTARICKRYVEKFDELSIKGQGLLLYGDVGTGKTFYAMCVANALIDTEYFVRHTSLAEAIRLAQDFENAEEHFNDLMRCHCIVLDDLGTERNTSFAQEQIYKHIDGWTTRNTPLIITTNHTIKELEAAAADNSDLVYARIYSRILEKCFPIKVNSVKRRDTNKEQMRRQMEDLLK